MDCNSCTNHKPEPVPYLVHEGAMARAERTIRRLWIMAILAILLLVGTNAVWIWYESQWEDITVEQEVETREGFQIVNGVGDLTYGDVADGES